MPKHRTRFTERVRVAKEFPGVSMARQEMRDDANINVIIQRFRRTGALSHLNQYQGQYGDFADLDFHTAMNFVAEAQSMFETVPADVRKHFGNDPGAFIEFASDPGNQQQMADWGLAAPPRALEEPAPAPVPAPEPSTEG